MTSDMTAAPGLCNREEIYTRYKDKVASYVGSRVNNAYEAEDIVSSVFLKIYEKIDRFDPQRASLSTWIYVITRNTVIDYYRKRKIQNLFSCECEEIGEVPDAVSACEKRLNDLADALEMLKERERHLIILHYYQGYTLKRIAERMGMSYINAKLIHAKALAALRMYLWR